MSNRGYYGYRKNAAKTRAWNNRVIKNFENDVVAAVQDGTIASLQQIAPHLLQEAVNKAGFSDYTGVLINSYMVGLLINGSFVSTGQISNINKTSNRKISSSQNKWNSYGMPGTTRIKKGRPYSRMKGERRYEHTQYRTGKEIRWMIQNRMRRNPQSTEFMTFNNNEFRAKGYGEEYSILHGMKGKIREGAELILTNAAPYAQKVHMFNEGSRVLPTIIKNISFVSMTRKQIERAIIAHRINQKYGK